MDILYFLPQFLQFHKYQTPGVHGRFATQSDYTASKRAGIPNARFGGVDTQRRSSRPPGPGAARHQRGNTVQHGRSEWLLCLRTMCGSLLSRRLLGLCLLPQVTQAYNKYISDFKGHLDKP